MESREVIKNYEKYRAKATDKILSPPRCFSLELKGESYILGTRGNISCIAGKQKSKKTFFVSSIAAAVVKQKYYRLIGDAPGKVVWIDTEQSDYHVDKVLRRVLRCCELPIDADNHNFLMYRAKGLNHRERAKMVVDIVNSLTDVSLVIVDGVRDLIKDPNSWEESGQIIDTLSTLAEKNNCHIITILHFNKGVDNLRGAIGTEMQNKAETVIQIEKVTGQASRILPRDCRNKEFPPFGLKIDSNGLPVILDSEPVDITKTKTENEESLF